MRASLTRALLALLAMLCALSPAFAQTLAGRVVSVADGDTLTILSEDNKQTKIRLHGVDTPETGQPFGTAAKTFTSKTVFGKEVLVNVTDTDRYGRTVGNVTTENGQNLNHSIVRNGYAWWYRQYAPGDKTLQALEAEARAAKRGLWAEPGTATAHWQWRAGKRSTSLKPVVAADSNGTRSFGASRPAGPSPPARTSSPVTSGVHITRTGSKYHLGGCRYLSRAQIAISRKDAEAIYSPCSVCNP